LKTIDWVGPTQAIEMYKKEAKITLILCLEGYFLGNSKASISSQLIPLYLLGSNSILMAEKAQEERLDSLPGKLPQKV
jgi:hypothetical protein